MDLGYGLGLSVVVDVERHIMLQNKVKCNSMATYISQGNKYTGNNSDK